MKNILRTPKWVFMVGVVFGLVSLVLSFFVLPCFRLATYTLEGEPPSQKTWPFFTPDSETKNVKWDVPLQLSFLHPSKFVIVGNGTVNSLEVNGRQIPLEFPQSLGDQIQWHVNLGGYLKAGENTLSFQIQKGTGKSILRVFLSPTDPLNLCFLSVTLLTLATLIWAWHLKQPNLLPIWIASILFFGIAIRIVYVSGTPYTIRAYDTSGHIEYIKYVAERMALPAPKLGFETHQAPLYYFSCGMLMRELGMESTSVLYGRWQLFSLAMSIGSFLLCLPISRILFPAKEDEISQCIFLAVLATYPGLVFTASRVSNDVPYAFLSFLWAFLLLRSWQDPRHRQWIYVFLCLGVGMLTKNTTLVLLGATGGCIAIHPQMLIRSKMVSIFVLVLVLLAIDGWYQIPRAIGSSDATSFVVATHDLNGGLRVPCSIRTILTFNPLEIVKIPFNSSWLDSARRMYFAEYFFKSSLFGEWPMPDYLLLSARALSVSCLILLPVIAFGFLRGFLHRCEFFWPMALMGGFFFGATLLYFCKCHFACNQDFRFQVLILLPLSYWLARGTEFWKINAPILPLIFVGNAVLFLSLLIFLWD